MIKKISLKNFKCFRKLDVEMSNLNVLAGINNTGKSSFIQSLLMMSPYLRTLNMTSSIGTVQLNNDLIKIGTNKDLFFNDNESDTMTIELSTHRGACTFDFSYDADSDVAKFSFDKDDYSNAIGMRDFTKLYFSYISADRMMPKPFYNNSTSELQEHNIGAKGEHTIHYLATESGEWPVENKKLLHPNCKGSSTITAHAVAWLSLVSPGIKIESEVFRSMGISRIGFYTDENKNRHSPNNVGFGLSYTLPVIVALLKAPKGGIVILENPEAHLHPKGQRLLGEMIALAASGGVQVIVETHSDHLLNGIRLAIKNKQIDKELVKLNYFSVDENFEHIKQSPQILEDGSLTDWPEGFFDEWDKAVSELF